MSLWPIVKWWHYVFETPSFISMARRRTCKLENRPSRHRPPSTVRVSLPVVCISVPSTTLSRWRDAPELAAPNHKRVPSAMVALGFLSLAAISAIGLDRSLPREPDDVPSVKSLRAGSSRP